MSAGVIAALCPRVFLTHNLRSNARVDQRALSESRSIQFSLVPAELLIGNRIGAAQLCLGASSGTRVYCTISANVTRPQHFFPGRGHLQVFVHLTPIAGFDAKASVLSGHLGDFVKSVLLASGLVDLSRLCIDEGENVWTISIDIFCLGDNGNLSAACVLAASRALRNSRLPELDETRKAVLRHQAFPCGEAMELDPVSVCLIRLENDQVVTVVDPCFEEESLAHAQATVVWGQGIVYGTMQLGLLDDQSESILKLCDLSVRKP